MQSHANLMTHAITCKLDDPCNHLHHPFHRNVSLRLPVAVNIISNAFQVGSTSLVTTFLHCQRYLLGDPLFTRVVSGSCKIQGCRTAHKKHNQVFGFQLTTIYCYQKTLFLTSNFIYWYIVSVSLSPTVDILTIAAHVSGH